MDYIRKFSSEFVERFIKEWRGKDIFQKNGWYDHLMFGLLKEEFTP